MLRRLRRAWVYRQIHGFQATLHAVWRLHVYGRQRVVILAARLADDALDLAPAGIVFRLAIDDDLAALPALRVYADDGEWVHVARDGDRVVAFRRAARDFPAGMLAAVIQPAAGRLFTRETFVAADRRHRGLGIRLSVAADRDLVRRAKAREIITAVDASNFPALRMFLRKGARPIAFVDAFRCLRYHRYTVSTAMPPDVQSVVDESDRTATV